MRGSATVARQAHYLEAVGSIPTPATNSALNSDWNVPVGYN